MVLEAIDASIRPFSPTLVTYPVRREFMDVYFGHQSGDLANGCRVHKWVSSKRISMVPLGSNQRCLCLTSLVPQVR